MRLTNKQAQAYADALADVLCWFHGFRAGNSDAWTPEALGSLDKLRDLSALLKRASHNGQEAASRQLAQADALLAARGSDHDDEVRDRVRDAYAELVGEQLP